MNLDYSRALRAVARARPSARPHAIDTRRIWARNFVRLVFKRLYPYVFNWVNVTENEGANFYSATQEPNDENSSVYVWISRATSPQNNRATCRWLLGQSVVSLTGEGSAEGKNSYAWITRVGRFREFRQTSLAHCWGKIENRIFRAPFIFSQQSSR